MKYTVEFCPSGKRGLVEAGESLLEAARRLGVGLRAECGGGGICGKCQVVISVGSEVLPSPKEIECRVLKNKLMAQYRLACRTPVSGPMQVEVPQESLLGEVLVLTEGEGVSFKLEPTVQQYHLSLQAPSLGDPLGDAERVLQGLEQVYGLKEVSISSIALTELPVTLRQAGWDVTVTIWSGQRREQIDIQPGYVEDSYGVAVDIGTTTLALYLVDLKSGKVIVTESMINPQVTYGADVVTRMDYAVRESEGKEHLRQAVTTGINQLLLKACARAGVTAKHVAEMIIVGNTVMHHLFLGLETQFLVRTPFTSVVQRPCDLRARDLGLEINPAGNIHLLPIIAGFVGADVVGDLVATQFYHGKEVTLLIDIGTNGELILGNESLGLTACSVAAGPAFEGGHITFGMSASPGAIEHVRIDPASCDVQYRTIGGGPPKGVCGSGILDAVAEMLQAGIILPSGKMETSIPSRRLRQGQEWIEFVLEWAENTVLGKDIVVTQKDVREVQLAKAAFRAGIRTLMQHMGVKQVERVVLAGAFGSYLDPKSALAIGMLPPCDSERIIAIGNAAGTGARMALLSKSQRTEAANVARSVNYLELTAQPDFGATFLDELKFSN
ncbi:MAG: ASKHA domain-containing protein [Candidatus Binatia bacterium]